MLSVQCFENNIKNFFHLDILFFGVLNLNMNFNLNRVYYEEMNLDLD